MGRDADSQRLFEASGSYETDDKLVSFLYELMRDHLSCGMVEKLVLNSQTLPASLTNGFLARYAEDLAARLTKENEMP